MENSFNKYVVKSILINNQFGISEVNELRTLDSRYFLSEEYPEIEKLIKHGDLEAIKSLPNEKPESTLREYLEVMLFNDQDKKAYSVTVYDSDALQQDPQVIEIYML